MLRLRRLRRIGLVLDLRQSLMRAVRRGICEYALPDHSWVMRGLSPAPDGVAQAAEWGAEGLIVGLESPEQVAHWRRFRIPMVGISFRVDPPNLPRVGVDDREVGRMGAEYLATKGFRSLAFVGSGWDAFSVERARAFEAWARESGRTPEIRFGRSLDPREDGRLGDWLERLPRPTGLLASDERWGVRASEVARERGLSIPHDLALLAVGDDDACLMTHPPMSSIALPGRRLGLEAARLLEALLHGRSAPADPVRVPPLGVTARASTDRLTVDCPTVARALRFIEQNACGRLGVETVAREVGLNRRWLEIQFRRTLDQSPLEVIRRARVSRARQLLAETDLPVDEIARACGFSGAQRLTVAFRELQGDTPGVYRRRLRLTRPLREG